MDAQLLKIPMPKNLRRLEELVLGILKLPALFELKIAPTGLEVRRGLTDDEGAVVPQTLLELAQGLEPPAPDLPFLLTRIALETLAFDPARHPLHTLMEMMDRVVQKKLYPALWFVARGDGLDSFVAMPIGTGLSTFLGLPVHYVAGDELPQGKLLLLGSNTHYGIDATYGVTADIGG